jgi:hypothetical protein
MLPETSPKSRKGLPINASALLYSVTGAGRAGGAGFAGAIATGALVLSVVGATGFGLEHPASKSANKQRGKTRIDIPLPLIKVALLKQSLAEITRRA